MLVVLLLALGGLTHAARSFAPAGGPGSAGTALSFGYLLLTAFLVGELFKKLRLPKLTGYIATGVAVGPWGLGLVPEAAVQSLGLFSGVAIALIALTAGTELELRGMRPLFRSIGWISLTAIGATTLLLAAAVFLARRLLPFLADMPALQALSLSLVLGVVMVAQSPAVVLAIRDETAADGPMVRTVLGVVVIADLVVILLFAIVSSLAKSAFGASADVAGTARLLAWEILGSLLAGVLIGLVLAVYIREVAGGRALFLLAVSLVVAEVGRLLDLDPLLIALSAGIFIRNATRAGDELHREIEASALPVYVIFFAVAGASIHLDVLRVVGVPAALFVAVRACGFLLGTQIGAHLAGAPEAVRRYAGFGLLPQAGLALALALLFGETFPQFGAEAGALTLGVVTLNELLAPALYRFAIVRSGEASQRKGAVEATPLEESRTEHAEAADEPR